MHYLGCGGWKNSKNEVYLVCSDYVEPKVWTGSLSNTDSTYASANWVKHCSSNKECIHHYWFVYELYTIMDIYVNRHCPARTHNKHIHTHSHTHIHTYKHIQSYIVDTHTQIHIRVGSRHSRSVLIIRNTVVHVAIQTRLNLTLHSCNYYHTWITDHVQVWEEVWESGREEQAEEHKSKNGGG